MDDLADRTAVRLGDRAQGPIGRVAHAEHEGHVVIAGYAEDLAGLVLVADRTGTQFVGDPGQVADQLERLRDATEADELIITTITHDHADRVRSYQLLAEEWARR